MTLTCSNCGQVPSGPFCQACGQRAGLQPFTLRVLMRQVPLAVFDLERGAWHTLKGLLLRPGHVINGYLDGQRVRYSNPFTLLLLFVGINAVLFPSGLLDFSRIVYAPRGTEQMIAGWASWMFQYYSLLLLLLLPLAAGITRWCFAAWPRNYAEHLVINAYITAETTACYCCLFPVFLLMSRTPWLAVTWNTIGALTYAYYSFALVKVFGADVFDTVVCGPGARRKKVVVRSIAAILLYVLSITLPAWIAGFVYALAGGVPRS